MNKKKMPRKMVKAINTEYTRCHCGCIGSKTGMTLHKKIAHGEKPDENRNIHCGLCDATILDKKDLVKHVSKEHKKFDMRKLYQERS